MATEKTQTNMKVETGAIATSIVMKYLGLGIASSALTSNVRELRSKRRLLISVTHSLLLYGCEIWGDALS